MRSLVEGHMSVAVRSSLAESDLEHSVKAAVAALNPNVAAYNIQSMNSMLAQSGSLRDFDLILLGAFSFLALSLVAVGVYAVMAFFVSQRTSEIGVRIALGANRSDILFLVLKQGARLAITGAAAGAIGGFCVRRLMASYLYGLISSNAATLLIVPLVMVVIVLVACWVPAGRATKIDPMSALRHE
jgi:putative ABC transport system permease protein